MKTMDYYEEIAEIFRTKTINKISVLRMGYDSTFFIEFKDKTKGAFKINKVYSPAYVITAKQMMDHPHFFTVEEVAHTHLAEVTAKKDKEASERESKLRRLAELKEELGIEE